ncbi:MAG: acetylglutamate kinase [Alistipes sp.]|nr:acetylglutamate kinase [Alistipes sp.]
MKIKVIKIGGKLIENSDVLASLCDSLAALGEAFVLVHGGGVMGSHLAKQLGVEVKMHEGRRITDAATLDIAVMAYAGLANKRVVSALQSRGVNACGLSGCDMAVVKSHRRPVKDIDWGFVGDVDDVNADVLALLLDNGVIPVISPITFAPTGELLNTNADSVASAVATGLAAKYEVELVFTLDKPGVLLDVNDDSSLIETITPVLYAQLRSEEKIHSGMIPKIDNAYKTIEAGVKKVRITSPESLTGGTVVIK